MFVCFFSVDEIKTDGILNELCRKEHRQASVHKNQWLHRASLSVEQLMEIWSHNTAAQREQHHNVIVTRPSGDDNVLSPWWEKMNVLNTSPCIQYQGLSNSVAMYPADFLKVLTGERTHDNCFVCSPKESIISPLFLTILKNGTPFYKHSN